MLAVQALGWFRKAADQSHPKAVYRIALAYETGDCGVPVNRPRAAAWMRASAARDGRSSGAWAMASRHA